MSVSGTPWRRLVCRKSVTVARSVVGNDWVGLRYGGR